jgi:hypothetical protein
MFFVSEFLVGFRRLRIEIGIVLGLGGVQKFWGSSELLNLLRFVAYNF